VPYHLKPSEPVPAGVRRIVREEIASAARQLSGKGDADRDEAIHEARKSMKKIRGALRLMRPELDAIYPGENAWFREVGLRLSEFRDAGAMLETFHALLEEYRADLGRRKLASIRRGLVARKQQHGNLDEVLRPLAAALRLSARRVPTWPLGVDGFAALAPGLESAFRKGRRALDRVRKSPTPENYHRWRKRVKDHWYHVRLLEKFWNASTEAYEKSLKDLETWLGDDHNLVVLEQTVLAEPRFANAPDIALFLELSARYHKQLRGNALKVGKHIYGEKPRQLRARLERLWEEGHQK